MIRRAAGGAGEAARDPLDKGLLVYFEFDHMGKTTTAFAKKKIKCFRLMPGARKAIEDRAPCRRFRRDAPRSERIRWRR
jgi:hypothetical protein